MKLQRSVSRRIGRREYVKHQVVIPNDIVTLIRWNSGDHIEARISKKGLLLCRIDAPQSSRKLDYEQFKAAVTAALMSTPQGHSWSELRARAGLEQITPSPIWVRRMEEENRLERIRDREASQVIWKLTSEGRSANLSTLNSWTGKTTRTTNAQDRKQGD